MMGDSRMKWLLDHAISKFIKENYLERYAAWARRSENGFYIG